RRPRPDRARARDSRAEGVEEKPRDELRIEVGALLRHRLAARRDLEDVLDPGRAHEQGDGSLAVVDSANGLAPVRRVAQALLAEPVDALDVELARSVDRLLGDTVVDADRGPVAFEPAELVQGRFRVPALLAGKQIRA